MLSKRMCFGSCDPGWEGRCQWNMEEVHVSPLGMWRVQEGCQEEETPELKPNLAVSKLECACRGIWQKMPRGQRRGGEPIALPLRTHIRESVVPGRIGNTGLLRHLHLAVSIRSTCRGAQPIHHSPPRPSHR